MSLYEYKSGFNAFEFMNISFELKGFPDINHWPLDYQKECLKPGKLTGELNKSFVCATSLVDFFVFKLHDLPGIS